MSNSSDITVITASYNSKRFLRETVESVASQSVLPVAHLIIDDCSTDGSYQLALQLATEFEHIKVLRHTENQGFPAALNTGIKVSETEFVAILDSDDIAFPDWLKRTIEGFENYPDAGLVGGGCIIMTEKGENTGEVKYCDEKGDVATEIKQGRYMILHPGTVIRRAFLSKVNFYNQHLKSLEDKDMFINMALLGPTINVGSPLIYYRKLKNSQSRKTPCFQQLMDEYFDQKVRLIEQGCDATAITEKLAPLVEKLLETKRLQALKSGEYEYEMAKSFIKGGERYTLGLVYLLKAMLRGYIIYIPQIIWRKLT